MRKGHLPSIKSDFTNYKRTICEVHREIYDELRGIDGSDRAIELLEEAYRMGKKLAKKLLAYKYNHQNEADVNLNIEASKKIRLADEANDKLAVYTCITAGKDILDDDQFKSKRIDYIAFVDDKKIKSDTWKVILIKDIAGPVKTSKFYKVLPHRNDILTQYRISLWIDGRMRVISDPYDWVVQSLKDASFGFFRGIRSTKDLYQEAEICKRLKKDDAQLIDRQIEFYRQQGHPKNFGVWGGGILPRRHNDPLCVQLGELWWKQILKFSCRDQISLPYVLWKIKLAPTISDRKVNQLFQKGTHHKKERLE